MIKQEYAITLIELLIATSLIGVLVVGISSLYTYTHFHLRGSDYRAQLQNEASYVLEHMAKNITGTANRGGAIGDSTNPPVFRTEPLPTVISLVAIIDSTPDGIRDINNDYFIEYRYDNSTDSIVYCAQCTIPLCMFGCFVSKLKTLSSRIYDFNPTYNATDNYLEVELTACWDPTEAQFDCGTIDNPAVTMRNRINMPAVSVN